MSVTQNAPANTLGLPEKLRLEARLDKARFNPASLVLLAPATVLLLGLFLVPVVYAIYLGFTNLQLIGLHAVNYRFTGWANVNTLVHDATFYQSIWLTVLFVVGSGAVGATLLGLVMAIAMQDCLRLIRQIAGALAIVAWTLPPTTIAIVWKASSTESGIIPTLLGNPNYDLLYDQAMLIVCLANSWSLAGLAMIMFSAALRNVPEEILAAARLEGASRAQTLFKVTLPMLRSTIVTSALLMTLLTFGNFTLVYLMTAGGPGNQTNILPVYSYLQGFKFFNLGYSALLGNVIVLISAVLGGLFVLLGKQRR
ncbi:MULTISPECIES: sugar ABC transporter permease [unclassified Mesorhizobium]|uniref:carbohydrate ABC transporter permease n=1 Tax=unclassified Mesorhizobium TaxID=325217 RepID=UPI000FDB1E8E|nr:MULTISPECIES: sugar ABC transporter permease [unclassified Mesorhizobium]TGQ05007.1 sugar ABC transporter permease [Mesorhizobium sp. M2E.F.Ca.ET.219.01.1.1]TGS14306.1 sugar ABC transporter permease [Mesorhizobium sp. M2E.F.Ca.ET.209.01.1.1]TGT65551.1 sugar ABC transporter permease [Mesorhizobium sp. M2E.F.Ca.ET.166.01.1.1]TGV97598.1 sugar ABC transporter permease [Mesorhizobium sp. M2E.F.Ca.ET.154.01.1.1]